MMDPFLFERMLSRRPCTRWDVWMERPSDAGMRDFCPLWHGVHSANDEPDGPRAGDDWGMLDRYGPTNIRDGWRIVLPAEVGRSRLLWRGEA